MYIELVKRDSADEVLEHVVLIYVHIEISFTDVNEQRKDSLTSSLPHHSSSSSQMS